MHHKRRRPKHQRAGCLMCKPNKDDQQTFKRSNKLGHKGFGKLRKEDAARRALKECT